MRNEERAKFKTALKDDVSVGGRNVVFKKEAEDQ